MTKVIKLKESSFQPWLERYNLHIATSFIDHDERERIARQDPMMNKGTGQYLRSDMDLNAGDKIELEVSDISHKFSVKMTGIKHFSIKEYDDFCLELVEGQIELKETTNDYK